MKKRLLSGAFLTLLLGGCAIAPGTPGGSYLDEKRIAAVENVARANGVTVVWVNLPTKSQP